MTHYFVRNILIIMRVVFIVLVLVNTPSVLMIYVLRKGLLLWENCCFQTNQLLLLVFIQNQGRVDRDEMYRVFNMGIGYVLCVRPRQLRLAVETLERAGARPVVVGQIVKGRGGI